MECKYNSTNLNAKPNPNPNYNPYLNPILMDTPTNPNPSLELLFYSAPALLAMQTTVIARGDLSVLPVFCSDE